MRSLGEGWAPTASPSILGSGYPGGSDDSWRSRAACRGMEVDLFFPVGRTGEAVGEIARAKAICARCPVRRQCLAFALASGQHHGVWGGTSEDERAAASGRRLRAYGA